MSLYTFNVFESAPPSVRAGVVSIPRRSQVSFADTFQLGAFGFDIVRYPASVFVPSIPAHDRIETLHVLNSSVYQEIYLFHARRELSNFLAGEIEARTEFNSNFTRIEVAPNSGTFEIDLTSYSWFDDIHGVYNIHTRRHENEVRIPLAGVGLLARFALEFLVDMVPGGFLSVGNNRLIGGPRIYWYPHPRPGNAHGLFPEFQYICFTQALDIRTAAFAGKKIEITLFLRVFEDGGRVRIIYDNYHFWGEDGFAIDQVTQAVDDFFSNEADTINDFFNLLVSFIPTTLDDVYLLPGFQVRNAVESGHTVNFDYLGTLNDDVTIVLENPQSDDIPLLGSSLSSAFDAWRDSL